MCLSLPLLLQSLVLLFFLTMVQMFCVALFVVAASLFGTIIAEVNEILAHLTKRKVELEKIFDSYLAVNPR